MSATLVDTEQIPLNEVLTIVSAMTKKAIDQVQPLTGGKNSRVFKLTTSDNKNYAAKFYFRDSSDKRDRLNNEYGSLEKLAKYQVKHIPQPIAISKEHSCAIYSFLEGSAKRDIKKKDIDAAIKFMTQLKTVRKKCQANDFIVASEAHFSMVEVYKHVYDRLTKLMAIENDEPIYKDLSNFLIRDLSQVFVHLQSWMITQCDKEGFGFYEPLAQEDRILSPSDFGFHNALCDSKGGWTFVDFEYFGWDDPAKMISDFLLHPAMNLTDEMRQYFFQKACASMKTVNPKIAKRVELMCPLFGLKWCLIFLNEFLPSDCNRRHFANTTSFDADTVRELQLTKAKAMFKRVSNVYKEFPYHA